MKYIVIVCLLFPIFAQAQTMTTAEWYVREYFRDTPVLAEIARCESTFTHFKNGEVLHGVVNSRDVGIMQINLDAHGIEAERLGFDLYSIQGNLEYAKYLYSEKGASPWIYSRNCWRQG